MILRPIERIPENSGQYNQRSNVDDFVGDFWLIGIIERLFVGHLARLFPEDRPVRVLDIGTGPGFIPIMLALRRPAWRITALDLSDEMLARARKAAGQKNAEVNWVKGSAESLPFESETFDLVLSHFALHEFPSANRVLADAFRVLGKNGTLCFQDLCRPSEIGFKIALSFNIFYSKGMGRQYRDSLKASCTGKEVEALAQDAAFTHARVNFPLPFILRLEAKKG